MKFEYLVAIGAAVGLSGCASISSSVDAPETGSAGVGGNDGAASGAVSSASSSGGATSAVTAAQTSTGPSSASAGAGGSALTCDDGQDCGDFGKGCLGCAAMGLCATQYNDCANSAACYSFSACAGQCADDATACDAKCSNKPATCAAECANVATACLSQKCVAANADGAQKYSSLVQCVVCDACPKSCVDLANECSP